MQPSFVAAIDFGTTFTGLAFAPYPHGKQDVTLYIWDSNKGIEVKAPTTVLFHSSGKFASFGFEAVRDYYEKSDQEKLDCYFFQNFKMELQQKPNFNQSFMLASTNNPEKRVMPIIDVISAAMKFLKDSFMNLLQYEDNQVKDSQVRWVITVPAIWQTPARQLMREAAYMAGLASQKNPQNLIIASEPECAAISMFENEQTKLQTTQKEFCYPNYMIVDCGGHAVEVSVYQVLRSEKDEYLIREEYNATSEKLGEIYVNNAFIKHLESILTEKFIKHIKAKTPASWYEICRDFEYLKRTVSPSSKRDSSISIRFDIIKEHKIFFGGMDIEESFKKCQHKGMTYKMGRLWISALQMESFLEPQTRKIIAHLCTLLDCQKITVNAIYMIGSFSELNFLIAAFREFCSSRYITLVVPKFPSAVVVNGAVKYGFNSTVITHQVSSYTDDIGHMTELKLGESMPVKDLYINKEGIKHHINLLTKVKGLNEENLKFVTEYIPAKKDQASIKVRFFKSTKAEVDHVTDYEAEKLGELNVPLDDPSKAFDGKIQVTLERV